MIGIFGLEALMNFSSLLSSSSSMFDIVFANFAGLANNVVS